MLSTKSNEQIEKRKKGNKVEKKMNKFINFIFINEPFIMVN